MDESTNRRDFLKKLALFVGAWAGGVAFAGRSKALGASGHGHIPTGLPGLTWQGPRTSERHLAAADVAAAGKSRVVLFEHSGLTDEAWEVQRDVLERVLDEAMVALTGESSAAKAWGLLFSSDERVGLKPNGLAGPRLSTATDLILATIDRLTGIGVKAENIIVWERDDAGIVNCGLEVKPKGPGFRTKSIQGDFDEPVTAGEFRGRLANIVTQQIDAIINLPILKAHPICGATLAMKNHYGTINNPEAHHGNNCDPYVADLNAIPAIRDKTRLIVCDATRGQYEDNEANPQFMWRPNALLASRDPVAHDAVGCQVIEAMRAQVGRPTLAQSGQPAKHIHSAAQRGLGSDDPSRIELIRRTLG